MAFLNGMHVPKLLSPLTLLCKLVGTILTVSSGLPLGQEGPSSAYSLPVHSFHTRRDRVASLKTCRLHGAAIQKSLTTRARPSPDLAVWLE